MKRPRSQNGAVAVLVGIMVTLLFGIAALSFDLGNAWARRRAVQTEADLAALAAATDLHETAGAEGVRATALDFLQRNAALGQLPDTWTTADLADGSAPNGEVTISVDGNRVQVTTPTARVDFGFAQILGFDNVDVSATAVVELKSPGYLMPMYVGGGCAWGQQTISDPANGHVGSTVTVPTLSPASPVGSNPNDARLTGISPAAAAPYGTTPLTISGNQLRGVTAVGFTSAAGEHVTYTLPSPSSSQTSVTVPAVPATVTATEALWFVRVWKSGAWSDASQAQPFTVGSPMLDCVGSASGNFGSLRLPRTDVPTGSELAMNIAAGVEAPLSAFPAPVPAYCDGHPLAVEPDELMLPGTNCVQTDPGIPATAVTQGLVAGVGSQPGLLAEDTTAGCDPVGGDGELLLENVEGNDDFLVNNDVLTCFFTSSSASVSDVSTSTYAVNGGEPVISPLVFDSPRFLWLPLLSVDPSHGTSHSYPIVSFRPAFITGQPPTATAALPAPETATNGLTVSSRGVTSVKVVMLNPAALPRSAATSRRVTEYLGTGTKVLRLVE